MAVDVKQGRLSRLFINDVVVPDLFIQSFAGHKRFPTKFSTARNPGQKLAGEDENILSLYYGVG
jgi:hypothetical protein